MIVKRARQAWLDRQARRAWEVLRENPAKWLDLGNSEKSATSQFVNIDIGGGDIQWDIRRGIPLPDKSVRGIYSSHMLEHLSFEEIKFVLLECCRVLSDEGELWLCLPDASRYLNGYASGEPFTPPEIWHNGWPWTSSAIDSVNYIAYMGGEHKFMFDSENTKSMLKAAGFLGISERDPDPDFDDPSRIGDSIYFVARK